MPSPFKLYLPLSKNSVEAGSKAMQMSSAGLKPASFIAATIKSKVSLWLFKFGANPPSSPTLVLCPADFNFAFNA